MGCQQNKRARDHKGGKESILKETRLERVVGSGGSRGSRSIPKANKLVCKSASRLGHQSFRDINGQQSKWTNRANNNAIWLMYENCLTLTSLSPIHTYIPYTYILTNIIVPFFCSAKVK